MPTLHAPGAGLCSPHRSMEHDLSRNGTITDASRKLSRTKRTVRTGRAALPLRPCGIEDCVSRMRHHWSNVIKAASYLHSVECRDTFIRKERGDKSMM